MGFGIEKKQTLLPPVNGPLYIKKSFLSHKIFSLPPILVFVYKSCVTEVNMVLVSFLQCGCSRGDRWNPRRTIPCSSQSENGLIGLIDRSCMDFKCTWLTANISWIKETVQYHFFILLFSTKLSKESSRTCQIMWQLSLLDSLLTCQSVGGITLTFKNGDVTFLCFLIKMTVKAENRHRASWRLFCYTECSFYLACHGLFLLAVHNFFRVRV